MNNFVRVHNYDNEAQAIISSEMFKTLQFMFSQNCSYQYLSEEEAEHKKRMELTQDAN